MRETPPHTRIAQAQPPAAPRPRHTGAAMRIIVYPRETPPHTRTARAQPPAAHRRLPPPPPQSRGTQSYSAPTPLKQPMLTPEGGPRPRVSWTHEPAGAGALVRLSLYKISFVNSAIVH